MDRNFTDGDFYDEHIIVYILRLQDAPRTQRGLQIFVAVTSQARRLVLPGVGGVLRRQGGVEGFDSLAELVIHTHTTLVPIAYM